jgi:hypothetical protein
VKGRVLLQPNELDWARLLEVEATLGAEIAAAEDVARIQVATARTAAVAAVPDPQALAALSVAREQAALERQRSELARLAADADNAVRALSDVPGPADRCTRAALDEDDRFPALTSILSAKGRVLLNRDCEWAE